MKTPLLVSLLLSLLLGHSRASVIFNDAAIIDNFFGFDEQTLTLTQSIPSGEGLFAISITTQSFDNYLFEFLGIAEEYALFQASPGLLFTPNFVDSTLPFISNDGFQGSGVLNLAFGETAYLAYWDDRGPLFDGIPNFEDNFGWVAVTPRSGTGLEVVNGVTAIDSGIIVGTSTKIPEPTVGILLLGSISLLLRRHR